MSEQNQSITYDDVIRALERIKHEPKQTWDSPNYYAFLSETGQENSTDAYIKFLRLRAETEGGKDIVRSFNG